MSATDQHISFQMSYDPSLEQQSALSTKKDFGGAALDPKLQAQLSQVLNPESHGKRSIKVESTQLDNIQKAGSNLQDAQSPAQVGESAFGGLFKVAVNTLEQTLQPTKEVVNAANKNEAHVDDNSAEIVAQQQAMENTQYTREATLEMTGPSPSAPGM